MTLDADTNDPIDLFLEIDVEPIELVLATPDEVRERSLELFAEAEAEEDWPNAARALDIAQKAGDS